MYTYIYSDIHTNIYIYIVFTLRWSYLPPRPLPAAAVAARPRRCVG